MSQKWVEITIGREKRRHALAEGLTRVGGSGASIEIEGSLGDELQIWNSPWKVVLVGNKTTPLLNGRAFQEEDLALGDSIQWCGAVFVFGGEPVVVEEFGTAEPARQPEAPGASALVGSEGELRAWQRLQAGMLVELGLADKKAAKRWQEAVVRGEFDADACARDLLRTTKVEPDDPRLVERAGRLERDLLMIPAQRGVRGKTRQARSAVKGGTAFLLVQFLAILVYSLLIVVVLFLMRVRHDYSIDELIDRGLELVTP